MANTDPEMVEQLCKVKQPVSRCVGALAVMPAVEIEWEKKVTTASWVWSFVEGDMRWSGEMTRDYFEALPERSKMRELRAMVGDAPALVVMVRSLYYRADEPLQVIKHGAPIRSGGMVWFPPGTYEIGPEFRTTIQGKPVPPRAQCSSIAPSGSLRCRCDEGHDDDEHVSIDDLERWPNRRDRGRVTIKSARYVTEPVTMSASEMVEHLQAELSRARRNHAGCEFVQRDLAAGIQARDLAIERLQCELREARDAARADKCLVVDQRKTIEGLVSRAEAVEKRAEAAEKRGDELLADLVQERARVARLDQMVVQRDKFIDVVHRDVVGGFTAGKKCECGKWVEIGNASATALAKPVRERGLVIRCQSQVDPDE